MQQAGEKKYRKRYEERKGHSFRGMKAEERGRHIMSDKHLCEHWGSVGMEGVEDCIYQGKMLFHTLPPTLELPHSKYCTAETMEDAIC